MRKNYLLPALALFTILAINMVQAAYVISPEMIQERYGIEVRFVGEADGMNYFINGQDVKGNYYVILGNESIKLLDFVYKYDGSAYIGNMPCVAEGNPVWPFEHCCEGTEPYQKPNYAGQLSCVRISPAQKAINDIKYRPMLWVIIALGIIAVVVAVFIGSKAIKKK